MNSGTRADRVFRSLVLSMTLFVLAGCRTSSEDVRRWATTAQGPRKLVAVLLHDKYPLDLRVEAALTMVWMRPRGGKQVGLLGVEGDEENKGLIRALAELPPGVRAQIVGRLIPRLVTEMRRPPPKGEPGQQSGSDPSLPYKDAAFALLTLEHGRLVPDPASRAELERALADWVLVNFSQRVDETSQLYGVEQVLRHLKAAGVRRLPELMIPDAEKLDLMARLVAELGDEPTKLEASRRLVEVARFTASQAWKDRKAPGVQAANEASKLKPTPQQFEAQLRQYQEEELTRVFGSLKKVGGDPAVQYLLDYAATPSNPAKLRAAALAALEGNLIKCDGTECDPRTTKNLQAVLALARSDEVPDEVRDQALRRVGEAPRKLVVNQLYDLFKHNNWKVRWMAAELILKMSESKDLPEFMDRLGKAYQGMAMTEPLQYGNLLSDLKGTPGPEEWVEKFAAPGNPVPVRLSALSYYYWHGTALQIDRVARYENDTMRTPKCRQDAAGCEWKCTVGEGQQATDHEITTVGEFVRYCVRPAMEKRRGSEQTKPKPGSEQSGEGSKE